MVFTKISAFANGPSVLYGGADLKFSYYDQTPTYDNSSSTYAINNWHHVVLTIGSDQAGVLYVNGSSAATFSGAFNSGGLDMFSIAVDYDSTVNVDGGNWIRRVTRQNTLMERLMKSQSGTMNLHQLK